MTRKISSADFENAIQAYVTGEGAVSVARRFHCGKQRVSDELKARGLWRDPYATIPCEEIAARYTSGESENAIAKSLGVSRNVIATRLRVAGAERRTSAAANQLLASQTPLTEHHRRIRIAQDANRGRKQSFEHRCHIAASRQTNISNSSPAEIMLVQWLADEGIWSTPQQAIGPYNVDIGAYPVAVEILGGAWHAGKSIHPKRTRYILDQGWSLVFIWSHIRRSPLTFAATDYVAAFLKELRSNPSSVGQYRVIRGDGQELARGSADTDDITIVVPGYESYRERSRDGRSWR